MTFVVNLNNIRSDYLEIINKCDEQKEYSSTTFDGDKYRKYYYYENYRLRCKILMICAYLLNCLYDIKIEIILKGFEYNSNESLENEMKKICWL